MIPANGRVSPDRLDGAGATTGEAMVWDGARWAPGSAGGGPLGYCVITVGTWPLGIGTGYTEHPGSLAFSSTYGDPGVTLGTTDMTVGPGLFTVSLHVEYAVAGGASSTDVHLMRYEDIFFGNAIAPHVGSTGTAASDHAMTALRTETDTYGPGVKFSCSGGSGRTYDIGYLALTVTRWAFDLTVNV